MRDVEKKSSPGLRTGGGRLVWRATKRAVAAGYRPKTANLSRFMNDISARDAECFRLQNDMERWLRSRGAPAAATAFDGTIGCLIDLYQRDPESRYQTLKTSSRQPYDVYLRLMKKNIGARVIDECDGRDVKRWFAAWKAPAEPGGPERIARARTTVAVLKAALTFGVMCRFKGCTEFRIALDAVPLQGLPPRTSVITAEQVVAARKAAHAAGQPPAALAFALQFEGAIRQWDVVGQWVPLSEPVTSALIYRGKKWIGPTWAQIDADMILRLTPGKTSSTSGAAVTIDLRACPMVMEELAGIVPPGGPLIVSPDTGRPYSAAKFNRLWRDCAAKAGIPAGVWSRDLRASGVTEGRDAAAPTDDLKKMVGHTAGSRTTATVYDRGALEAHRRVAAARTARRNKTSA